MMNVTLPTLICRVVTFGIHTHRESQCGGAGLYIKSCYDFEVHKKL